MYLGFESSIHFLNRFKLFIFAVFIKSPTPKALENPKISDMAKRWERETKVLEPNIKRHAALIFLSWPMKRQWKYQLQ